MRPETGTMKFEGDWRGVFIRGDNAFGYGVYLKQLLDGNAPLEAYKHAVAGLMDLLLSADERNDEVQTQHMKPFTECVTAQASAGGE